MNLLPQEQKIYAKLEFFYGVMNSSKTTNLLQINYNYKQLGYKPLILKPCLDTRNGEQKGWGIIESRLIKENEKAYYLNSIYEEYEFLLKLIENEKYNIILVDEVQFFSKTDIFLLSEFVDNLHIPTLCFGLKTDSNGDLFESISKLIAIADKITEVKQICKCGHKATMHLRKINGKAILGNSIEIDSGDVEYESVCRKCWKKNLTEL